ncbi:MAG: dihydropteroate synthase [Candidatus Electronema sp. V4]|uniref:dihydropteroate synthase n=1 Tax=Candidatus Electronema sp. V4 TaxID=3454756 RepID=UPI0040556611
MKKPQIMGILNVTPDSFSDGGSFFDAQSILRQAERLLADGADIIDIGGESTRPFAQPVTADEELRRVIPAIEAVRSLSAEIPISIDTTKAIVARAALAVGATIINDISALRHDPEMISVARSFDGPVIIMHMQGTPGDMQLAPQYADVVAEICAFFQERTAWMQAQGIRRERIILDPGIGFGKTLEHNLAILRNISAFKALGLPVLIGHSRKSFLGKLGLPMEERDWATALVSALCARQEADMLRVHDVAKTAAALRLAEALEPQAA